MKIGTRTYNEQETAAIEEYKKHIQLRQKNIDDYWNTLAESILNMQPDDCMHDYDCLWDYVMNDFKL